MPAPALAAELPAPHSRRARSLSIVLCTAAALAAGASQAAAATLSLKSGNGVVGGPDSVVKIVAKSAPSGTIPRQATIVAKNPAWATPLGSSQWVSTAPNGAQTGTAGFTTYAVTFTVPASVGPITLAGNYYADNIGTAYLNGPAIASQTGLRRGELPVSAEAVLVGKRPARAEHARVHRLQLRRSDRSGLRRHGDVHPGIPGTRRAGSLQVLQRAAAGASGLAP